MGPGSAREIEDEVDLVSAGGAPVFVGEGVDLAEVGLRGEVEQHVDPTELAYREVDQACALSRIGDATRVKRDHLATGGMNHLDGLLRRLGDHVASDDQRALARERQCGGASHAPAGTS